MGFSSCGTWASLPQSMWDLPGPRTELVSPELPGKFLTTGPLGTYPWKLSEPHPFEVLWQCP